MAARDGDRNAVADGLAGAFAGTFWWGVALAAVAIIPSSLLPRVEAAQSVAQSDRHPLAENGTLARSAVLSVSASA